MSFFSDRSAAISMTASAWRDFGCNVLAGIRLAVFMREIFPPQGTATNNAGR